MLCLLWVQRAETITNALTLSGDCRGCRSSSRPAGSVLGVVVQSSDCDRENSLWISASKIFGDETTYGTAN